MGKLTHTRAHAHTHTHTHTHTHAHTHTHTHTHTNSLPVRRSRVYHNSEFRRGLDVYPADVALAFDEREREREKQYKFMAIHEPFQHQHTCTINLYWKKTE